MMSRLVIGIDEAGYGPSMGPLVVGATVWRVPADVRIDTLSELLQPELKPSSRGKNDCFVPLGDSKKILVGKNGWFSLCCGARWLLEHLWGEREDWWLHAAPLASSDWDRVCSVTWYEKLQQPIPRVDSPTLELERGAQANASDKLKSVGIELVAAKARLIDEPYFNEQVEVLGNKATLLSETSLALAKELCQQCGKDGEPIEIFCDKHGGRNRYQALLMHCFDDTWFTTDSESSHRSQYRANWNGNPLAIQFQAGGDSLIPSAAASVLAKWLREVCMLSLNQYWQLKSTTTLAPTAGYYVDAVRFANDIDALAESIGMAKQNWWRAK